MTSHFLWGEIPYPITQVKSALHHYRAGKKETASEIAKWQKHICAFPSLFSQGQSNWRDLAKENEMLFASLNLNSEMPPGSFFDRENGFAVYSQGEKAILSACTGCKSTMGSFLKNNSGVVAFGPQGSEIESPSSFGLAGRGFDTKYEELPDGYIFAAKTHLASPNARKTESGIEDTGFSGLWIDQVQTYNEDALKISFSIEGLKESDRLFVFFGKGDVATVAGVSNLRKGSLDRYKGPAASVLIGGVSIKPLNGAILTEVIPLEGEHFWGANFLVAYTLERNVASFLVN